MTMVFIIILNFNGGEEIVECLKSIRDERATIVVVDNGSSDRSVEKILKLVQDDNRNLKLIFNKKNLGFAGGCNKGIKYVLKQGAEAVLLLNPDTIAQKGFLKPLLENPADIVAPIIKFRRGKRWTYDYGGKVNWWLGRTKHIEWIPGSSTTGPVASSSRPTASPFGVQALDGTPSARATRRDFPCAKTVVDYVSGCCMLIKRPVLERIGFLDERYFLYFEDVDFCLRARKAGFKVAVEPKSMIIHKLTEGRKKSLLKSNLIFINRWIPFYRRPLAYLYWLVLSIKVMRGVK